MPETIGPSPFTPRALYGEAIPRARPRLGRGHKPLSCKWDLDFQGKRRRTLRNPRKIARFANTPQTAVQHWHTRPHPEERAFFTRASRRMNARTDSLTSFETRARARSSG